MSSNASFTEQDFEDSLVRFDAAWHSGTVPRIDEFLPPEEARTAAGHGRRELLLELVMIDLEYRWRRAVGRLPGVKTQEPGESHVSESPQHDCPLLEVYIRQYPELGPLEDVPVELIADGYRVRRR